MLKNKFLILAAGLLACGCFSTEPTYTKEKVAESIVNLCKKEYRLEPKVWLVGETLMTYLPLENLVGADMQLNQEVLDKISNMMLSSSRVILSMRPRPEFMVTAISDIKIGLDYIMIACISDILKFHFQNISRGDYYSRNVIIVKPDPAAIADSEGRHLEKKEIKLVDFIRQQVAQRIEQKVNREAKFQDYFLMGKASAELKDDIFKVDAPIKRKENASGAIIDTQKEVTTLIAYVFKAYNFRDFLLVEVENSATGEQSAFSRAKLEDFL